MREPARRITVMWSIQLESTALTDHDTWPGRVWSANATQPSRRAAVALNEASVTISVLNRADELLLIRPEGHLDLIRRL